MSNIFQKVGNCKVEAKFSPKSPLSYGDIKAVGKAVSQSFKDAIAESDANPEFKEAIEAEPVKEKKDPALPKKKKY